MDGNNTQGRPHHRSSLYIGWNWPLKLKDTVFFCCDMLKKT